MCSGEFGNGKDLLFWASPKAALSAGNGWTNLWTSRKTGLAPGSFPSEEKEDDPADEGISQENIGDFHDPGAIGEAIEKSPGRTFPNLRNASFLFVEKGKDSFYERRINPLLGQNIPG